jgi:hypothetical protein
MQYAKYVVISLLIFPTWGCVSNADESTAGAEPETSSARDEVISGTAIAMITFTNSSTSTANSDSANFAGTVMPTPMSSVTAGLSDHYTETGIGNVTSFHINYTVGSKKCHFDTASFPAGGTILTPPACTFTKMAQSQGSTFATCTATLTAFDLNTCSQSVTFSIR